MPNKNTKISRCSFCGSTSWGRNCKYSPYNNTHYHGDVINRCVWCGSKQLYGKGCKYSPSGYHGMSSNAYTQMVGESFPLSRLIYILSIPFTETKAYKLGIINENGDLIKKPITDEEKKSYTLLDRYIFLIKKLLNKKIDFLNETIFFETTVVNNKEKSFNPKIYKAELEFKNNLEYINEKFKNEINKALENNLSLSTIEKIILEVFSK